VSSLCSALRAPVLTLIAALSLAVGCAQELREPLSWRGESPPKAAQQSALSPQYQQELKRWTRRGEAFERFEGRLFVEATCLSPRFEMWRAAWHGARLSLTQGELKDSAQQMTQRAQAQRLFFVAVATQDQSSNDLRPRGSSLKAHLISGGEAIEPLWINELNPQERLSAEVDFPYFTPLYRAYWVAFPSGALHEELKLRVSGLKGTVTLSWNFKTPRAHAERGSPK